MYKNHTISVMVPAYNEERLIKKTIEGVPDFVDHIIVVDDNSKDNTAKVVTTVKDKRVTLIRHQKNTGLGGAIRTAVAKAKELKTDIAVVMAGDNQMDPAYLPSLLDPIVDEGYDFTKQNRFYATEGFANMPKHRVFGSIMLAFMTRVASGYWHIIDPQNGYVCYGPRVLRDLNFGAITPGYALENDVLINLNILGFRVKEVPGKIVYADEQSNMNLWKIIPSFSLFLFFGFFRRIFKKYFLRGFHPIFFFLLFGNILFWFGLIFGL
jgi:glycosyltransferase involved in cell wall biosynthesis